VDPSAVAVAALLLTAPASIAATSPPLAYAIRATPSVGGLHSEIFVRYTGRGTTGPGIEPGGDIVTLTGPAGEGTACSNPLATFDYELGAGAITLQIGPGAHRYPQDTGGGDFYPRHISIPIRSHAWCPGRYHGEIEHDTGGDYPHIVATGTFTFRIAPPAKHSSH
jgi:hypothetical protein